MGACWSNSSAAVADPAFFFFWQGIRRGASWAAPGATATSANRLPLLSLPEMSGVDAHRPAAGQVYWLLLHPPPSCLSPHRLAHQQLLERWVPLLLSPICCSVVLLPAHESAPNLPLLLSSFAALGRNAAADVRPGWYVVPAAVAHNTELFVVVSRTYFRAGSVCPENLAQMPRVCHIE